MIIGPVTETTKKKKKKTLTVTPIKTNKNTNKIAPISKTHAQQYNLDGSKKIAPTVSITTNNVAKQGATNILNNALQQDIKNKTFEVATGQNKQQIDLSGKNTQSTTPVTKEGLEIQRNQLMTEKELQEKRDKLSDELFNYDREERVKWWDDDLSFVENLKNVGYKTFLENKNNKYVEDEKYNELKRRFELADNELKNKKVQRESANMNGLDKVGYTITGNVIDSTKGIESTVNKLFGQSTPVQSESFDEMMAQEARKQTSGIAGAGLDIIGSMSKMLPQMIVSGPINSSAAAMTVGFANYGGSAYNEAKQMGATEEQATAYGITIGGLETGLEKLLGGFESVYGKSALGNVTNKIMGKVITNTAFRQVASGMAGEFTEEYLQEFLQPIVRNAILEEKNGADFWNAENLEEGVKQFISQLFNSQNLYAGTLGAVSSGLMSGPSAISQNASINNEVKTIKEDINPKNIEEKISYLTNKGYDTNTSIEIVNKALKDVGQPQISVENVVQNEDTQEINSNTPQISQEIGQNQELSNETINNSQNKKIVPTVKTKKNNTGTTNFNNKLHNSYNSSEALIEELSNKTKKNFSEKKDVKFIPINEILPSLKSGGYRTTEQIEQLTNEIREKGITSAIEVSYDNEGNIKIVNGNHRIDIANKLGLEEVPVKYVKGYDDFIALLEKESSIVYNEVEEGAKNYGRTRNSKEIQYNEITKGSRGHNDRSGIISKNITNNTILDKDTAARAGNVGVYSKAPKIHNRSSSNSTSSKNGTRELENSSFSFKQKQLDIINRTNPADDDVHTWIRTVEDIKTFDEAFFEDGEFSGMDPDFTETMAKNSQGTGKIIVYSSYPIENGVFVSPSKMEASQYAGGDESKLYSKEVDINDVAWIDGAEGQYARVDNNNQSSKKVIAPIVRENNTINEKINKKEETIKVKPSKESISLAKTINETIKQDIIVEKGKETKQRRWIDTSLQSDVVEGKILLEDLDPKKTTYVVQSNKKSLDKANTKLNQIGYEESVEYIKSKMNDSKVSLTDVVLAQRLIQEAIQRGDTVIASNLIMDTAILGTDLGQKIQALSMIQRLTPEGQLRMFQKIVKRAKTMGDKSYDNVEITPEMVELILGAYKSNGTFDQTDLNNRVEQFKQKVAEQMKTTTGEKIVAWRYLSMLGNPKTHIRNVVSNIAMYGTLKVKNAMARTIETAIPMNSRTKTWKKSSDAVKEFAKITTNEMKDIISGEGKYSEKTSLESKKKTFNNKVLEGVSNFNSNMLSAEDWFFSKRAFESTLREYLTANGIKTNEDIQNNPELIEKAKQYAVEQAEIATFRQYSKIASAISKFERKHKVAGLAVSATIPFKKTPVNIAKTGVKYSPIGLIKSATYNAYRLKTGEINASQFVDNLSQGLTGTSLTLIGYVLAKAGILKGAGDDDKEGKFDSYLGKQTYSINIGGQSFSISWLSPVAMPLLVGANAYEQLEEQKEWDMNIVVDTLTQTLDPLSEMSFISGLTDTLNSYQSSPTKMISSVGTSMVQNYVSQFFPTLLSQIAATFDDTKRTTRASNNSKFKEGEETVRMLMYKIPGLRNLLEPSTDIWGNEVKQSKNIVQRAFENFIAPYSRKEDISTKLDKELKRVYQETGESSVIPGIPYAYTQYDKVKYQMSAKEYTQYKKTYGETANEILNLLIKEKNYKDSPDKRKARMIEKAFKYATELSKAEFLEGRDIEFDEDDFKSASMSYSEMSDYIIRNTRYLDGER